MDFVEFPKMARLSRDVIVTEKIDGTNACIAIDENGVMHIGSRTRWITPEDDNHGFAKWAMSHKEELLKLGKGTHFGEFWGSGIQRSYGLKEKRFSLFNVQRWILHGQEPKSIPTLDPRVTRMQEVLPECCGLVPILYRGPFETRRIEECLWELQKEGSKASPGFMNPEGVVVYHIAGNVGFKKTLKDDGVPKSIQGKI